MKHNILIVDPKSPRGPLQWDYYNKLIGNNNFNIFITHENDGNIEDVMSKMCIERVDLVLVGIYRPDPDPKYSPRGNFILNSADYMKKNGIKCILDSADNEEFDKSISKSYHSNISKIIDTGLIENIVIRYYPSSSIDNFVKQTNFDFDKIKCIPWGIDPIRTIPEKNIDVSFIASICDTWIWHKQRVIIRKLLKSLPPWVNVHVDSVHGNEYNDILSRSKIFIVEGSMRLSMTQKYLEGGVNKCLLLGERPLTPTKGYKFFNEKTMVVIDDWNSVNTVIIEVLKYPEIMELRTQRCVEMIKKNFNVYDVVNKYEELFDKIIHC